MAIEAGSTTYWQSKRGIVQDGLVLNLDAGVDASYGGSGTTWTDLSSTGASGTLTNGPTFDSANGGSIVFDGSDDVCITSFVCPSIFTWSVWFKAYDVDMGQYQNLISIQAPYYMLFLLTTGTSRLGFWSSDGMSGTSLGTPNLSDDVWYNAVFIREGNSVIGGYKAYVNAIAYGSTNTGTWSSSDIVYIGNRQDVNQQFTGNISNVSIYNRALSANEVAQNFNATRHRFGV